MIEKLMYKRLSSFVGISNIIFFTILHTAKTLTTHALINLTESIRQIVDGGNFSCGIFVDLLKVCDT